MSMSPYTLPTPCLHPIHSLDTLWVCRESLRLTTVYAVRVCATARGSGCAMQRSALVPGGACSVTMHTCAHSRMRMLQSMLTWLAVGGLGRI